MNSVCAAAQRHDGAPVFGPLPEAVVRLHRSSFQCLTGLPLGLQAAGATPGIGDCDNPFCRWVARLKPRCAVCYPPTDTETRTQSHPPRPARVECFAGFTRLTSPVICDGRHYGEVWTGPFFVAPPSRSELSRTLSLLGRANLPARVDEAYFATARLSSERIEAISHLLNLIARDLVGHLLLRASGLPARPPVIDRARHFIATHPTETLSLAILARHLHISRFYLCRLFKRHLGLTISEFVTRLRVERARSLLIDPSLRVTEIAAAAGFGSIPHFNASFKRLVGVAPTTYRRQSTR